MDEITIPVLLCDYLNKMDENTVFVPEVWREKALFLSLTGGVTKISEYVDGSAVLSVPFELRARCGSSAIAERIEVIDKFSEIDDYIKENPVTQTVGNESVILGSVYPSGGVSKSAVYESGEEEYRAVYSFRYLKKA